MKIQIDHKTVRYLLEKDPEFEVLVKDAIMRTSIKHHAHTLMDNEVRIATGIEFKKLCEDAVIYDRQARKYNLSPQVTSAIRQAFDDRINQTIEQIAQLAVDKLVANLDQIIIDTVNEAVVKDVKSKVNKLLEQIK